MNEFDKPYSSNHVQMLRGSVMLPGNEQNLPPQGILWARAVFGEAYPQWQLIMITYYLII